MADVKISALPSATTPLAGTEVLPIVQSSATVKVAISDVTAGRVASALAFTVTGSTAGGVVNGTFLSAVNQVGIATNSTERITVTNGGNVGIGTSSPNVGGSAAGITVLTLSGSSSWSGVEVNNNTNTSGGLIGFYAFTSASLNSGYRVPAYIGSWLAGATSGKFGAELRFYTQSDNTSGAAQRMVINNAGNIGIATSSPVAADGSANTFQIGDRSIIQSTVGTQTTISNNAYYDGAWKRAVTGYATAVRLNGLGATGDITFTTSASGSAGSTLSNWDTSDIKMVILNSGNVGIGTSSPGYKLDVNGQIKCSNGLAVQGTGFATSGYGWEILTESSSIAAQQSYNRTSSTWMTSKWYANDHIWMCGGSQKMTLDSSGNVGVGTTSLSGLDKLLCMGVTSGTTGFVYQMNNTNKAYSYINSANTAWITSTVSGYTIRMISGDSNGVELTNGATSWSSLSDERFKTDLKPIENAATKVAAIRAVTGRFKTDDKNASRAFLIAQDVQKVLPEAVHVPANEEEPLGLRYTDTIPLLVAAIQEQQQQIDALKAEMAELRAN